jgi:hypothetical protein
MPDDVEDRHVGPGQVQHEREVVLRDDAADRLGLAGDELLVALHRAEEPLDPRGDLLAARPLEGPLEVGGGDGAAVVELLVGLELEGVGQAVRGDVHALRHVQDRLALLVVEGEPAVEVARP